MKVADVVIVGGGVIGLSIAYELARKGVMSTVLDRGRFGREASWAGAGIIAPPSGRSAGMPDEALRTLSARLFPEWSQDLQEETGLDNGYRRSGAIDLALEKSEAHDLHARVPLWRAEQIEHQQLDPADARRLEPQLTPDFVTAYLVPGRAQIRNPRHLNALCRASQARGVQLREGIAAEGFEISGDRIVAVRTAAGPLPCGALVMAAGAWSQGLLAGIGVSLPTPPIKGQIALFRTERPVLTRIIEQGPNYLVPRDDGRLLAGASEEHAGFDTTPTPSVVTRLREMALRLCPALADAALETSWAGLRPGNRDNRPSLGKLPNFTNAFVATGHRRAGLQLSPGTAVVMAALLQGLEPPFDLTPFRPDREPGPPAEGAFLS